MFIQVPVGALTTTRLNTEDAAKYCGLSASFLHKARVSGTGPRFSKIGRRVLYDTGDLDSWLATMRHASTAEYR